MIILVNVKITDIPLNGPPYRGKLGMKYKRMDIWKYALASFVPLLPLVSKVVLNIDLASAEYAGQESKNEDYIRSLYPDDKLIIRWTRNNTTADWRRSCEQDVFPIDDDIILNLTNDDHIFVDKDLNVLSKLLSHLSYSDDPYAQIIYSHYGESIRMAAKQNFTLLPDKSGLIGHGRSVQSIDICKKERWRHYWLDHDFGELNNVFRPDEHLDKIGVLSKGNTQITPIRELVRHYDGYDWVGQFTNYLPSIEIPEGFFENNIRIAYGYDTILPGYTNINPAYANLRAYDDRGVDYKCCLEDIPMMWKGRIAEIKINPDANLEYLKKCRDDFFYDKAMYPINGWSHIYPLPNPYPKDFFKGEFLLDQTTMMKDG